MLVRGRVACEAAQGPVGDGGSASLDEHVRSLVRSEMAAAALTQCSVAMQASVSQPVLCTYLGGKASKCHGKNSIEAVRSKLLRLANLSVGDVVRHGPSDAKRSRRSCVLVVVARAD